MAARCRSGQSTSPRSMTFLAWHSQWCMTTVGSDTALRGCPLLALSGHRLVRCIFLLLPALLLRVLRADDLAGVPLSANDNVPLRGMGADGPHQLLVPLSRTSVARSSTTFRGSLIPAIRTKLALQRGHAVVLTGRTPPRHLDRQGVLPLLPHYCLEPTSMKKCFHAFLRSASLSGAVDDPPSDMMMFCS